MLKGGATAPAKVEDRSGCALLVRWTVWELLDEWRPYGVFDGFIIVVDEWKSVGCRMVGCKMVGICGQLEGRCGREGSDKQGTFVVRKGRRSGAES